MARPGLFEHPKFLRLVHILKEPVPHVLGYLECLWLTGYQSGNPVVGDETDVELAARYPGPTGTFFQALLQCRFIELAANNRYQIHDLMENAPGYVTARRHKESERKKEKRCLACETVFHSTETHAKYCCGACRVAAWRSTATELTRNGCNGELRYDSVTAENQDSQGSNKVCNARNAQVTPCYEPPAPAPAPAPAQKSKEGGGRRDEGCRGEGCQGGHDGGVPPSPPGNLNDSKDPRRGPVPANSTTAAPPGDGQPLLFPVEELGAQPAAGVAEGGGTAPRGVKNGAPGQPGPQVKPPTAAEFLEAWNAVKGVLRAKMMTGNRMKHFRARVSSAWWVEHWREALARLPKLRFCTGDNRRGWMADIDFFLRPDTVTKILEGRYDDERERSREPEMTEAERAAKVRAEREADRKELEATRERLRNETDTRSIFDRSRYKDIGKLPDDLNGHGNGNGHANGNGRGH